MSDNMKLYNAVRKVPQEALKRIEAGRLKGMTDIAPQWRIKTLTEQFGPCGFGWKYVIKSERLESGANDEIAAFVDIDLFVKMDGEWSEAIPGSGGSMFVAKERNGPYTSDEAFKKALTDAISVSCKALGVAADVYWDKDPTKYTNPQRAQQRPAEPREMPSEEYIDATTPTAAPPLICEECGNPVKAVKKKDGTVVDADRIAAAGYEKWHKTLCVNCQMKHAKEEKTA